MKKYGGVWPTMIAAFDTDGNLDLEANAELTNKLIEMGSDGLFAVCQSSEMFFLNLDEKVALAECVVKAANGRVPVIASGHTSDDIEEQIKELQEIAKTGVDAVILVSNRLAKEDESSDILLKNLQLIMDSLPEEMMLGIYECPYPYRRLLTNEELKFCADSNRIIFLKDVSCDIEIERERVHIVEGSDLHLFNANTETLMDSLIAGYDGYNGVMGNFHIDLYKYLFENFLNKPMEVRKLQNELTEAAKIENYSYPLNAKYHGILKGWKMDLFSRRIDVDSFTEEHKEMVHKLIEWEDFKKMELQIINK